MTPPPVSFWRRVVAWWSAAWLWFVPLPLLLDGLAGLAQGDGEVLIGSGGGYALMAMAGWLAMSDRPRQAAITVAAGTGLAAWLSAGHPPLTAGILAIMAGAGGWMLWGEGRRLVPEKPPAPPPPPDPLIVQSRAYLAHVEQAATRLDWGLASRFRAIATEARGILAEAERDPADLVRARRFLVVHIAGLAKIADRVAEGAAPPNLIPLLDDMRSAATELRTRLHAADHEAAEIQVEVLARRLKEEGLA